MKESFSELYARLYNENFEELESLRAKAKKSSVLLIFVMATIFILASINPIFILLFIVGIFVFIGKSIKKSKQGFNVQNREKTYPEVFKEKVVGPLIENVFEQAKYDAKNGISSFDYRKCGFKEYYDRYSSEDLIIAPLKAENNETTFITFAEVHTQTEHTDDDGHTHYTTVFQGLVGKFLIPKDIGKGIFIRANGRVSGWNKNKVKMDMSEFEKIFDVESDDKILTMRILTADVMAEMIDLYEKYKYKFEINILNDTIYMRLRTGPMFEPNVFKSSMEYKTIEKYYLVLRALMSIAEHIYDTILKLEV